LPNQQIYDAKPSTADIKAKNRVTPDLASKSKAGKLVNQHQAQYLTNNAQVLTASGGHPLGGFTNQVHSQSSAQFEYI
jgi:hypothetical protein